MDDPLEEELARLVGEDFAFDDEPDPQSEVLPRIDIDYHTPGPHSTCQSSHNTI
jgi:hypothetical protein